MEADPHPLEYDGGDEVARRRSKRRSAALNRPVPGCPTITLGELAEEALAATAGVGGADEVAQFLAEAGYSQEATETILACLDLDRADAPGSAGSDVSNLGQASSDGERLRTLAQLEARLLEE